MEYLDDIGTKARKTGITAKSNVRRDEHDMEDLDDFFKDTTVINPLITERRKSRRLTDVLPILPLVLPIRPQSSLTGAQKIQEPEYKTTTATTSTTTNPVVGLGSPLPLSTSFSHRPAVSSRDEIRRTPSKPQQQRLRPDTRADEDLYIAAQADDDYDMDFQEDLDRVDDHDAFGSPIEQPEATMSPVTLSQVNRTNENGKESSSSSRATRHMGSFTKVGIPSSASRHIRGERLFVSDKEEEEKKERPSSRVTVRGSSRGTANNSGMSTPGGRMVTSPLNSIRSKLNSPMQIPMRSISSASKKIALGKPSRAKSQLNKQRIPSTPPTKANSESEEEEEEDEEQERMSSDSEHSVFDEQADAATQMDEDDEDDNQDSVEDETIDSPDEESQQSSDMSMLTADSKRGRTRERSTIIEDSESDFETTIQSPPPPPRTGTSSRQQSITRSATPKQLEKPLSEHHTSFKKLAKLQREQSNAHEQESTEEPIRRSKRVRMAPLAYWRNERVVYEKKQGDLVPTVKEIITVDEPEPVKLNTERNKSRKGSRANSRANSTVNSRRPSISRSRAASRRTSPVRRRQKTTKSNVITEEDEEESNANANANANDEELAVKDGLVKGSEWIKEGHLSIDTFTGHGSEERNRRLIAWAPVSQNLSNNIVNATDNFKLSILFDQNREFSATGMMHIPIGGVKSMKSTDSTYFVFYCISGILEVTLSGSVFMINTGCSLEVPMGNFYQFVNKGTKVANLFFVQTRGSEGGENGEENHSGSGDDSEL